MTNEEYQEFTKTTNHYPTWCMRDALILGLASEAGEVAGKATKLLRGDYKNNFPSDIYFKEMAIKELGDVLWFISELCTHFDITLGGLMDANAAKLKMRVINDTIKGEGDVR